MRIIKVETKLQEKGNPHSQVLVNHEKLIGTSG